MLSQDERNELIEKNINLAHFFARRYANRFPMLAPDDLHATALLGITLAAKGFNPDLGVAFSTFCARVIFTTIAKATRKPQIQTIALETPIAEDLTVQDCVSDGRDYEELALNNIALESVSERLRELPERQRFALVSHARGDSQQTIARALGISQCHVSRILKKARSSLKSNLYRPIKKSQKRKEQVMEKKNEVITSKTTKQGGGVVSAKLLRSLGVGALESVDMWIDGEKIIIAKSVPRCVHCGGRAAMIGGISICRTCAEVIVRAVRA